MKAESKDLEVMGGLRLATSKLPPMKAFVLERKLIPIIAPIMGGIINIENMDMGQFAGGFMALDDAAQVRLTLEIFAATSAYVQGELVPLTSEQAINGAFDDVYALQDALWKVIVFNFFPTGVEGAFGAFIKKATEIRAANRSTSPT